MTLHWERLIDRSLAGQATEELAIFRDTPGRKTIDGCVLPTAEIILNGGVPAPV
jgi:hypothetical protein